MNQNKNFKKVTYVLCILVMLLTCFIFVKIEAGAVTFPNITVTFDPMDESVIVEGIPAYSADGSVEYSLEGYLNYGSERVETFCYAPHARPYDVSDKMAYIFNWSGDAEFLLPCSGEYQFTAYVTARYGTPQGPASEKGPKTTITITLHKKDESTNWGPGLPNTTVESYDLGQIKGKDKTIKIEEPDYTWTINGKDIVSVPDIRTLSLKVTANPETFVNTGVEDFFGDTLALKLNIEHNGEFGFTAVLDYRVGTEYTGKYANLFYVVGDGTFEYMRGAIVDESGIVSFPFTHASDYIVAVTDVEYIGQDLNPEPTPTPTPEPTATPEPTPEPTSVPAATPEPVVTAEPTETPKALEAPTLEGNGGEESTNNSDEISVSTGTANILVWVLVGGAIVIASVVAVLVNRKKK